MTGRNDGGFECHIIASEETVNVVNGQHVVHFTEVQVLRRRRHLRCIMADQQTDGNRNPTSAASGALPGVSLGSAPGDFPEVPCNGKRRAAQDATLVPEVVCGLNLDLVSCPKWSGIYDALTFRRARTLMNEREKMAVRMPAQDIVDCRLTDCFPADTDCDGYGRRVGGSEGEAR